MLSGTVQNRIAAYDARYRDILIVQWTRKNLTEDFQKKFKNANEKIYKRSYIARREINRKQKENIGEPGDFIMSTINITNARKDLYNLVEAVSLYHEPTLIVGKKANAVLISEEDWCAIQETIYLDSIPHMTESILQGAKESVEDCIPEDKVKW